MQVIGRFLLLAGLLGIPGVLVAGATQTLTAGVIFQVSLWLILLTRSIFKFKSLSAWLFEKREIYYAIHPIFIVLMGFLFIGSGILILSICTPGSGKDAMSANEIRYFSTVFLLLGAGISTIAAGDAFAGSFKKNRGPLR